jgi:hypothetical protein
LKGVIFDFDGPIFPGRKAAREALDATYDRFATDVGRAAKHGKRASVSAEADDRGRIR